jgi:hypothetical protein
MKPPRVLSNGTRRVQLLPAPRKSMPASRAAESTAAFPQDDAEAASKQRRPVAMIGSKLASLLDLLTLSPITMVRDCAANFWLLLIAILRFPDYNLGLVGYPILWHKSDPHSPSSERSQHPPEIAEAQFLVVDVNNQLACLIVLDEATDDVAARNPLVGLF